MLIADATPDYPVVLQERGVQGDVIVRLTLDTTGAVKEAVVVEEVHPDLDANALIAARTLRFQPALDADGQPVEVQVDYRFKFALELADQGGEGVPGSLIGQVLDQDELPLPRAVVVLVSPEGEQRSLTANGQGRFQLSGLAPGVWEVRVESEGFAPSSSEVEINPGEALQARFFTTALGEENQIVVWGRQTWREVDRTPLAVVEEPETSRYTLTRRDIEATPGALEDVARAVHKLPGVASDGDYMATFTVRGGNATDVVFLLDRVPLDNPFHLAGFNSLFNPDMIQEVTFWAGAPPAWVPAGTSAVMSVQSWDGDPRQGASDLDGAIDLSMSGVRAFAMGPIDKKQRLTFALAARRSWIEAYFQVMKWANLLDTAVAAPEFSEISARMVWRPHDRHKLKLTALRASDSLALADSEDESLISIDATFSMDNWLYLVSLDHKYQAPDFTWWTTLAYTHELSKLDRNIGGTLTQTNRQQRLYGRTDGTWTLGKHEVRAGVDASLLAIDWEGQVQDIRSRPTFAAVPIANMDYPLIDLGDIEPWPDVSGYLQHTFNGPVRLRTGVRTTYTGVTQEVLVSPRLGVSVPLPTATVPKLSWGIYQTTPRHPLVLSPDTGNPDIKSEQAMHFVAGVDQAIPLPWEGQGGLVRVEGYYIELWDLVVNPDDSDVVARGTTYTNDGTGFNTGVDVQLAARAGNFTGTVNYGWLHAERTNPLNQHFAQTVSPAQQQAHTFGIALEYQIHPRWRLTARYDFHTGRPMSTVVVAGEDTVAISGLNDTRLGPFHDLSLRAEWRKAFRYYRLSFYLEVLNATFFQSDFLPIISVTEDGELSETMLPHLPTRPFLGLRADF